MNKTQKIQQHQDAPGWGPSPVCWKCRGSKFVSKKRKRKSKTTTPVSSTVVPSSTASSKSLISIECPVCKGAGRLALKAKLVDAKQRPGRITKLRQRPPGFPTLGTTPIGNPQNLPHLEPQHGEELTGLVGDWRIFQKVAGHRWSTEDLCTGFYAQKICSQLNISSPPKRCLDLGCGIGTVALCCKWLFPSADVTGIEAQPTSFALAQRSVEYNTGTLNGIQLLNGDIRNDSILATATGDKGNFDLVTGTPPYFKLDDECRPLEGGMPSAVNSAPARNEFRGGVEIYCLAASAVIHPQSPIIITMAYDVDRVMKAGTAAGLTMVSRLEVCGKTGKTPLFACFCFLKKSSDETKNMMTSSLSSSSSCVVETIDVRGMDNQWTSEYLALMRRMGIPPS